VDQFARHALRFDQAIAQAPCTKALIASLMTGLYPSSHNTVTASVPFPETMTGHPVTAPISTDVLPSGVPTLAEVLHQAGYRTLGFTANPFLIEAFGFARGFDTFRFYPGGDFARADRLVADAVAAVQTRDREKPVFLWVHFMEPHSPYVPGPLTAGMFKLTGLPEPIAAEMPIPSWLLPGTPRDRRLYVNAYDDESAAADAAFDTLIREFRFARPLRNTVVVLASDHGEQFLDHGGWEHGSNLYDELIRVPLIMQVPGVEPGVIDEQVELIDVMPTLLDLAHTDTPPVAGHSLMTLFKRAKSERPALSEIVGSQYAVRDGGFKYVLSDAGEGQLFDLTTDPHERRNIAAEQPHRVQAFRAVLERLIADANQRVGNIRRERRPVDPLIVERLRSLGYAHP